METIPDALFKCYVHKERVVEKRLNSTGTWIQTTTTEAPPGHMYYSGLDVHKL
jgi:hypothetical protein